MPKYLLLADHFIDGCLYPAGKVMILETEPSTTMDGLDEEAVRRCVTLHERLGRGVEYEKAAKWRAEQRDVAKDFSSPVAPVVAGEQPIAIIPPFNPGVPFNPTNPLQVGPFVTHNPPLNQVDTNSTEEKERSDEVQAQERALLPRGPVPRR